MKEIKELKYCPVCGEELEFDLESKMLYCFLDGDVESIEGEVMVFRLTGHAVFE